MELQSNVIGSERFVKSVNDFASAVAKSSSPILLTGETGSGKTYLCRHIFKFAQTYNAKIVTIPLSEIAPDLFESHLFGHSAGAFTGATGNFPGLLAGNDSATILLEEIDCLPLHLQPKILRVIEEGTYLKIGDAKEKRVDLRFIATSLRCLKAMSLKGEFRMDLFQRLSVLSLKIPPLRERKEDIPILVRHFLAEYSRVYQRHQFLVADETIEAMTNYQWPGNIRELKAEVERWFVFLGLEVVTLHPEHLMLDGLQPFPTSWYSLKVDSIGQADENGPNQQIEKQKILDCLRLARWNKSEAAKMYGVSRKHFYTLIEKHGIK